MNLSRAPGTSLGGTPANIEGASPRHEGNIESAFDLGSKVKLDLVYRYVSGLPAVNAPAYSTGDARISWQFHPHIEFSLAGRNLLQPWHVEYAGDPGPPVGIRRSVYAAVAFSK
jgi:hypothetical protein